jgi:AcrR family transcriptional regulator
MESSAGQLKRADRFQKRREQTAHDLLEAARHVLSTRGYHATKVVDIAQAAKVGVGTFYLYYPTKEAIFLELVEDTVRKLRTVLDARRAGVTDPAESSRIGTETFFRFAQENRELFRIVFGHGASFHDVVRRCQETFVRDVLENLVAGMESGAFRPGPPVIWGRALIGLSVEVVSWWIEQEGVSIDEVTRAVTDLAFHGLAATPRPA